MFNECESLTSLDVSGVNTINVTSVREMFMGCSSLTSLDLSGFDTTNLIIREYMDTDTMFYGCDSLITVTAPSNLIASIDLPSVSGYTWQDENGTVCTSMAKGLTTTMVYTRINDDGSEDGELVTTDISTCTVMLSTTSYTYDGTAKKPTVTVKDGSMTLASGTDYTISYSNNVNAGTASVTVTGTGDYTGSVTKTFTIGKADQTITAEISSDSIAVGDTVAITALATAGTLTYSSDNTAVAAVSSTGVVTGISEGTAVITVIAAETGNYNKAEQTFTVRVTDSGGGSSADTLLLRRGSTFYLVNSEDGSTGQTFTCGESTDEVLIGDWDGDGYDTICLRRGSTFYISNSADSGTVDYSFTLGESTDEIIAGDWDGDGVDTLSIRSGNVFYIYNTLDGKADCSFSFGKTTDAIIVGDWDGDGCDTLCVRRGSTYYINNSLTGGNAETSFVFGKATDEVFAGKWTL